MVFEFIPGGELFSLLRSVGRIPEITATFYGAQVDRFESLTFLK